MTNKVYLESTLTLCLLLAESNNDVPPKHGNIPFYNLSSKTVPSILDIRLLIG